MLVPIAPYTFDASIDGADVNLNLTAGVTGDIFFNGAVGQIDPIGTVTINEADDVSIAAHSFCNFCRCWCWYHQSRCPADGDTGTVTINSNEVDLDGSIRTSGDAQSITITGGAGGIDLAADETITSTPAIDGQNGGAISITANAGAMNLDGDLVSSGANNAAGNGGNAGVITLTGTGAATITVDGLITSTGGTGVGVGGVGAGGTVDFDTANQQIVLESTTINTSGGAGDNDGDGGTVTFAAGDPVFLSAGPTVITTGATLGDINFLGTVNGTQDLTLTTGTGNISFSGIVGETDSLGLVTVNQANNVTISAFTSTGFNQPGYRRHRCL